MTLLSTTTVWSAPEILLHSSQSWDGGDISYPKGEAEITAVKLSLTPGKIGPFHCHPVPPMGYIALGRIEVETKAGEKIQFTQGQSVLEVMKTVHRGKALGGPAEVIVFYAGAKNLPTSVLPDHDPDAHCQSPISQNH